MNTFFRVPTADGRFLYPLTERLPFRHEAPNEAGQLETVRLGPRLEDTTFLVAGDEPSVTYTTRSSGPLLGYKLNRSIPGATENITADEYAELDYDAQDIYTQVLGDDILTEHVIDLSVYRDLPVNILDPASLEDPALEYTWEPGLPYVIYGQAMGMFVPGALVGVREAIAKAVAKRVPHATVWTHKAREGKVEGHISLTFEDGRTYPVKEGRRTRQVKSTANFGFEFPIPANISGTSKAAAVAELNRLIDNIVDSIDDTRPVSCAHCDGKGVVPSRDLKPGH